MKPENLPRHPEPVKMLTELYTDRMDGKLTQEQLEEACHYWAYDNALEGLRYYPLPAEPFKLKEWRTFSDRQKEALPGDIMRSMQDMAAKYAQEVQSITNENRSHLTYIIDMRKTFVKYNAESRLKAVDQMIDDFRQKGVEKWP